MSDEPSWVTDICTYDWQHTGKGRRAGRGNTVSQHPFSADCGRKGSRWLRGGVQLKDLLLQDDDDGFTLVGSSTEKLSKEGQRNGKSASRSGQSNSGAG